MFSIILELLSFILSSFGLYSYYSSDIDIDSVVFGFFTPIFILSFSSILFRFSRFFWCKAFRYNNGNPIDDRGER